MSHCPYGVGFNNDGKTVPLMCHQWSCDRCRASLARQWAWRASLYINLCDLPAYFWTLTLRGSVRTPYQGYRAIKKSWDTMRKRMQRLYGKWSYLAFVEIHPNRTGIPHFHCLSFSQAPICGSHIAEPIKDFAWQCGFGYKATEEEVVGWKAAWYVSKYASKHDPSIPRNFRRCRASRDWAKLPEHDLPAYIVKSRSEHTWEFIQRVSEATDVPEETLMLRYTIACNQFEVQRWDED